MKAQPDLNLFALLFREPTCKPAEPFGGKSALWYSWNPLATEERQTPFPRAGQHELFLRSDALDPQMR